MQFSVTFRHMEAKDPIRDYAREKLGKIKKYFPDPIMAHVVFSTERGFHHVADVNIQLHNGLAIKGRETTENMFSSIDLVMAKIERQVRRYKDKIRTHKRRTNHDMIPVAHHIIEAPGEEIIEAPGEEIIEAPGEEIIEAPGEEIVEAPAKKLVRNEPHIIKSEKLEAQPLLVHEAVMQMNLLHNDFLVFRNSETGEINVLYRLEDGNYGLIESGQV